MGVYVLNWFKKADSFYNKEPVQADPAKVGYRSEWGEHHGPVSHVPDFWNYPKGYNQPPMPLPKKIYHVTPFPDEIMREGFKTFTMNTGKQTFGGHGTYTSFTSLENAKIYQEGLKDMVRIANGMYSWQDAPSLASKWGVTNEKVPGIVEDVDRWSREGTEPWEDRLKLAHFMKSLSLRGGNFPLFVGVGEGLINHLANAKPENVAILEADSIPQEWHTGVGLTAKDEMKGKYTYNEGENEWRVWSPENIPPQNIRRVAMTNWYKTSFEKIAGMEKLSSVTYSIADSYRISQPKNLMDLCRDLLNFIYSAKLTTKTFQPLAMDIEPDTSSSGFDGPTGIINCYMRPKKEMPEERREDSNRIIEQMGEVQKQLATDPDNERIKRQYGLLNDMYGDLFATIAANDNPQEFIRAIEAWKTDKEPEGYKISYNPQPDTSRMYGVPVIRVKIEKNPSVDYMQMPEFNVANGNHTAILRMLGIPFDHSGKISAQELLQMVNAVTPEQQSNEVVEPGFLDDNTGVDLFTGERMDMTPDPADAWKGETPAKKAPMYDGGRTPDQIQYYLNMLRQLCQFAISNGFKEIQWA